MPRTLNAVQAERAGRSHIAPIPLVKLTFYDNHLTSAIDKVFYLSTMAVDYDYGNTGTVQRFLPFVAPSSDFFTGFVHIPQPDDLTAFHQSFDLQLSNVTNFQGQYRLGDIFMSIYEMINADVEISRLYVDAIDSLPVDLTAYDGDEHLVLFRGRAQTYSVTDSLLTLRCETVIPSMANEWYYASDPTKTHPRDLGKRLPRIYGSALRARVVAYDVGGVTTLAQDINNSQTGSIEVANGLVFPTGTFGVRIDDEATITCTARTATTITVSSRGAGAAAHEAGAAIIELANPSIYIVSDSESTAINAIYFINPVTEQLTRLDSGESYYPTVNLADASTISGRTVTSFSFTSAEMSSLLTKFNISGASGNPGGYDLEFFADVDGIPVPEPPDLFETREDFESGTWSVLNCTTLHSTAQVQSGTKSLLIEWDADAEASTTLFTANNLSGWNSTNATLALQTTEGHRTGNVSVLEAVASSAAANALVWWDPLYYATLYGFESGSWTGVTCSPAVNAVNPHGGTNSLELTVDVDAEASFPGSGWLTDSTSAWTGNAQATISLASGEGARDSGDVIQIERTGVLSNATWGWYDATALDKLDLSDDPYSGGRTLFVFDAKIQKAGGIGGSHNTLRFFLGNSTSDFSDCYYDIDDLTEDTWYTFVLNWDVSSPMSDETNVEFFGAVFGPISVGAGTKVFIDNIKIIKEDCIAQNNALGTQDLDSGFNAYQLWTYHDQTLLDQQLDGGGSPQFPTIREAYVWISQQTWTGTTIGSSYRRCYFDVAETEDTWISTEQGSYTDVSSPDVTIVDSMRVTCRLSPGRYARDPVIKHYFDDFQGTPTTTPNYDLTAITYYQNYTCIMFDFKIKKASTTGTIAFLIGTDEANYYHTGTTYSTADFSEDTWVTMLLTVESLSSVGSPDPADINLFGCEFNQANRSTSCKVYFDNIKIVGQSCVAQNNALGGTGVDLSTYNQKYRFQYYIDLKTASDPIDPLVFMWLSKDTGTSYTIPTNYQRFSISPAHTEGAWLQQNVTSTITNGDGTLTDTDTLRIYVQNQPGIYGRDPITKHYIDNLQANDPIFTYAGTPGDPMSHISDILKHFIEAAGESVASGDVAALNTALGASLKWGFDVRVLGFAWEEILQRMAFEARTNVFPIEETTGRAWRIVAANATYGWGSGTTEITQTHSAALNGRQLDDMATHFSFRYNFDNSIGTNSEEGFISALDANPSGVDVPIPSNSCLLAAQSIGNKAAGPIAFRCIHDDTTAQEVAGYYVQEMIDEDRWTLTLSDVGWFEGLLYNVGDVVLVQLPWGAAQHTCRIISMSMGFSDNTWTIVLVKVVASGIHT